MYTPDSQEIVSEITAVACITVISLLFGRMVASIEKPIYFIRGVMLALYSIAWAFAVIACMANSTNNGNYVSCSLSLYNCIIAYAITKMLAYLYFVEKIYLTSVPTATRLKSRAYLIHLTFMGPYIGIMILMLIYRIAYISDAYPYHCNIGIQLPASIAALAGDSLVSLLYTGVFAKYAYFPNTSQQTAQQASSLRLIARRTMIATVTSFFATAFSYCILIYLNGEIRGVWATTITCLGTTTLICVIHWVSNHPCEIQVVAKAGENADGGKPVKLEIKQLQEVVVLSEAAP
ncbi:hypothetical protein BX666DRAFT_2159624 [Dichotomocladium elegans]|nr:hypothetical protein BX666DRAFT_2159624 [Dichotomocladium elegans]